MFIYLFLLTVEFVLACIACAIYIEREAFLSETTKTSAPNGFHDIGHSYFNYLSAVRADAVAVLVGRIAGIITGLAQDMMASDET